LQGSGDMRIGIAARREVGAQQVALNGAIVGAVVPVAEVAVAEGVGA
jgi:hypothetical protein